MGRKAAACKCPERMLYAVKVIDRHLGEQQLAQDGSLLYAVTFDAYFSSRLFEKKQRISAGKLFFPADIVIILVAWSVILPAALRFRLRQSQPGKRSGGKRLPSGTFSAPPIHRRPDPFHSCQSRSSSISPSRS